MVLVASSVIVGAEIHASANHQDYKTQALRKLFVYQILVGVEQR
ncbi:MAG: hypothetical protein WBA99_17855 [Nodosilinea sp.]